MQETTTTPAPAAGTATATPAPDFDSFAAELSGKAEKPPEEKSEVPEEKPDDASEQAEEGAEEAAEDEAEPEEAAEEKPEETLPISKQLAAINRAKARAESLLAKERENIQRERAQVEELRQKYAGYDERLANFEHAARRAKHDLPSLLKHLGVTDYVEAAKQIYYASPEAAEKHKDEAQRYQRSSQIAEEVAEAKAETARLRAEIEAERQQARREKAVSGFLDEAKAFHTKAPLMSALATQDAADYRAEVERMAIAMNQKGEKVTAQAVIDACEKRLRKIAGIKPDAPKAAPKTQNQPSRENKTAPSIGNDPKKSQGPRPATSTAVSLDDLEAFASEVRGG